MKKLGSLLAVCFLGTCGLANANVKIEIDAGVLRTALGTTTLQNGAMLQIIATRTGSAGTFAAPTANSFVGGDSNELVVASFAFTQGGSGFVAGETDNLITFNLENTGTSTATTFDQGDALLLRWYPTLTLSSTAPGLGTTYGQYRSATGADGGLAWVTPADGTVDFIPNGLNFLTNAADGPNANTVGYADSIVTGLVPEPSTYAMFACGFAGLIGMTAWNRRGKRSSAVV